MKYFLLVCLILLTSCKDRGWRIDEKAKQVASLSNGVGKYRIPPGHYIDAWFSADSTAVYYVNEEQDTVVSELYGDYWIHMRRK